MAKDQLVADLALKKGACPSKSYASSMRDRGALNSADRIHGSIAIVKIILKS